MGARSMFALLLACSHAWPSASAPASSVVVVISAEAEWRPVRARYGDTTHADTPFGDWFVHRFGMDEVIFFHGGFGKVSAAASTQYAISRWHPHLVVNLGTCGGFGVRHKVGDVVLATETVIYDIIEQMGDSGETIRAYTTTIDPSAWPAGLVRHVSTEPIVSGDRDLVPSELPTLAAKYGASVGDWESGAIAWTAHKNATAVLILRSISDMVDAPGGDTTYGDDAAWQRAAARSMTSLLDVFESAVPALVRDRREAR
jgi:adenosylhomocysteine nucleosidase